MWISQEFWSLVLYYKGMKSNVFIFHGTEGYPEENWFPWLKGELEGRGHKVFVPQFPSPPGVFAKLDEWFAVLDKYKEYINEDTIIVTHSLGGMFLLHYLERYTGKIKMVTFAGIAAGWSFGNLDFDWKKIKNKADEFIIFHSDNDPYVSLNTSEKLAKGLGVELNIIPNAGHFNAKAGYLKFPELLEKLEKVL